MTVDQFIEQADMTRDFAEVLADFAQHFDTSARGFGMPLPRIEGARIPYDEYGNAFYSAPNKDVDRLAVAWMKA